MNHSRCLCLIGLVSALAACGGNDTADEVAGHSTAGASTAGDAGAAAPEERDIESSLSVTIGGQTYRSKSRVKDSGFKFGKRLDAILVADSYTDPSGRPEVSMTIITPTRKEGTFEIVFNQNKIGRAEGEDIAIVTFQAGGAVKLTKGLSGTLNLDTLETVPKGKNYAIQRLKGSFEGTFRSDSGEDVPAKGAFDYVR